MAVSKRFRKIFLVKEVVLCFVSEVNGRNEVWISLRISLRSVK